MTDGHIMEHAPETAEDVQTAINCPNPDHHDENKSALADPSGEWHCTRCGRTGNAQANILDGSERYDREPLAVAGEAHALFPPRDFAAEMLAKVTEEITRERMSTPERIAKVAVEQIKPGRLHPGIGVGAIVVRDGKLLLIKRKGAHGEGKWSVPGGWIEHGESVGAAAIRELREETGVVGSIPSWSEDEHDCVGFNHQVDEGIHAFTVWVEVAWESGDGLIGEDDGGVTHGEPDKIEAVHWVPFDEVPTFDLWQVTRDGWSWMEPYLRKVYKVKKTKKAVSSEVQDHINQADTASGAPRR